MADDISIILVDNDDDLLDVALFKQAFYSECIGNQISEGLALERILNAKAEGSNFWIAKHRTEPVGYAAGVAESSDSYKSQGIYTCPAFRNQGIGSALKKAQIDFARKLGCKEIWSLVDDTNKASLRVQEKCGFKIEPIVDGYEVRLSLQP